MNSSLDEGLIFIPGTPGENNKTAEIGVNRLIGILSSDSPHPYPPVPEPEAESRP